MINDKLANRGPLTFREAVLAIVHHIPAGQTMTYREVAIAAHRPYAYRAVGNTLHQIWQTDRGQTVPCHRVIRSDGRAGGYADGLQTKVLKLQAEGVRI